MSAAFSGADDRGRVAIEVVTHALEVLVENTGISEAVERGQLQVGGWQRTWQVACVVDGHAVTLQTPDEVEGGAREGAIFLSTAPAVQSVAVHVQQPALLVAVMRIDKAVEAGAERPALAASVLLVRVRREALGLEGLSDLIEGAEGARVLGEFALTAT